jgi:hypothetical protein
MHVFSEIDGECCYTPFKNRNSCSVHTFDTLYIAYRGVEYITSDYFVARSGNYVGKMAIACYY